MSDEQIISTLHLFISLLEKKNVEEKKANVLRCLEQGADVNAVDGNQRNNTPLHVAVIKDEKDIVQILLNKGAAPDVRNLDQKTPLDIARDLQTDSGKQILQLLNALNKEPVALEKSSQIKSEPPITAVQKPIAKSSKKSKQYLYSKRAGTSGVCGQLFETKLLSLVLLRALNDKDIEDFILGTNIDRIGALDDMCLRLKVKGHDKPIMIYLQAKHREDREKGLLTVENVRNDKGDFSLIKYFDSYLRIKESFKPNNSDDMFDGEFSNTETNLIIYTPAKDLFTRKLIKRNKLSVKVHEIISTSENGEVFQFDYEESDLESLTKMTVQDRVKSLGTIFLYFIMAEKDKSEVMMSNEHIARYHYVLGREVIIVSDIHEIQVKKEVKQIRYGSFRPEFFTSPSEYLFCLREIFYKEISSTHCDKTPIEDNIIIANRFHDMLQNPNAINISRVIGKLATYNEETFRLEIIETTNIKKQFNKNVFALEKIRDGLSKLEVQPYLIREAVWLKLHGMTFNLPPQFGNLDMSFRGTEDKVKNRIKDVVEKLIPLFTNYDESKVVEINDDTVGNGKLIQRGLLEINGGIGSAVGNLLVLDDNTKMFKFDLKNVLPKRSQAFLSQFLLFINEEELEKYRLKINIDGFPKYYFDGDQYDKRQANEFLNKLWFYTNQAQEGEVEFILKKEITKYYNNEPEDKESVFRIHSDAIYLQSHDEVQKWWMKPGKAHYLNTTSQYFKRAKDAVIDSPLLTVLNFMFIKKLQKLDISFKQAAVRSLHLHQMTGRLNIKTEASVLTALKINQHFHNANNFTFLEFDYVLSLPLNDYNTLIRDLTKTEMDYLIIIYEELKYYEGFCNKIKQVMNAFKGKNIIVVSSDALADEMRASEGDNYVSVSDFNSYLIDLTEDSQEKILENSKVVFQGDETQLGFLLNENTKAIVRTEILSKLLNKDRIDIGKSLIDGFYRETKDKYIDRFISHEETKIQVKDLFDLADEIVVIKSKSGMGKSSLLTHLSLNTKRMGPLPWIVRINLPDYENKFEEWLSNETDINAVEVIRFLSKVALKRDFEDKDVTFQEDGSKITIENAEAIKNPMVLFELEYFIELYNNNQVIFLLDDFNVICGHYEYEIMRIIKVLKHKGKRMWITTCSYYHTVTALQREFDTIYTLEPFDTKSNKSFLHRYFKTNLKLEKLNYEQFDNFCAFAKHFSKLTNIHVTGEPDREFVPIVSIGFHLVYVVAAQFFKSEVTRLSPSIVNDKFKESFDIDFNQYTPVDELLGRVPDDEDLELANTPLHIYLIANYFKCRIEDTISLVLDETEMKNKFDIIVDVFELYRSYAEDQIKNICQKENDSIDDSGIAERYVRTRRDFMEKHKKLGLFTLSRENDLNKLLKEDDISEVKDMIKKMQEGTERSNLIDCVVNGVPRFAHLVFAEYFAMECLTDMLKQVAADESANPLHNASLWHTLLNILLFNASSGIRNAFNYKLQIDKDLAKITNSDICKKVVFELLLKPSTRTQEESESSNSNPDTPLTNAIEDKLFNILNIFLTSAQGNLSTGNIDQVKTLIEKSNVMFREFGAEYINLMKSFVSSIQEMDIKTFGDILNKGLLTEVPLRHASNYCNSDTAKEMTNVVIAVANEVPAIGNNVKALVEQTGGLANTAVALMGNTINVFLEEFMKGLQADISEPEPQPGPSGLCGRK